MKPNLIERSLPPNAEDLQQTIKQIGIARFVGRINSGVIPSSTGYKAVQAFVGDAERRPFASRLTRLILKNGDSYAHR